MSTYTEELSSCENASNFYLDVLSEMIIKGTGNKIVSMNLDIDRGIIDFEELKNTLIYEFLSLQELSISQNYTSNNHNDHENYEQFISFLKGLKLIKFVFIDDPFTLIIYLKLCLLIHNINLKYTIFYIFHLKNIMMLLYFQMY